MTPDRQWLTRSEVRAEAVSAVAEQFARVERLQSERHAENSARLDSLEASNAAQDAKLAGLQADLAQQKEWSLSLYANGSGRPPGRIDLLVHDVRNMGQQVQDQGSIVHRLEGYMHGQQKAAERRAWAAECCLRGMKWIAAMGAAAVTIAHIVHLFHH